MFHFTANARTKCLITGFSSAALILWSANCAESAASVPDFSGYWGKNSVDPGEPPSGPGPVMNKTGSFYMRMGDDENPILKFPAAEALRKAGAMSRKGENFPTPSNQCWPMAPPLIWHSMELQILQQKDVVTILHPFDQYVRRVRIGGKHPVRITPSWLGDSIGKYEDGTLIIDTVGIKRGRYSMVDNYGTPQTENLHVVERIRLIDAEEAQRTTSAIERSVGRVGVDKGGPSIDESYKGKGLQVIFTVEDPSMFTKKWSAQVVYRHALGGWEEDICADNPHDLISGVDTDVPHADKPDF